MRSPLSVPRLLRQTLVGLTVWLFSAGLGSATEFLDIQISQDGDNVLRYLIDFETDVETSTRAVWSSGSTAPTRGPCGPRGTVHQARVWGLTASRTVGVRLEDCDTGQLRQPPLTIQTPALPTHLAPVELAQPCEDCDTELVMFSVSNQDAGWDLFVVDAAGDLVWYQEDTGSKHGHTVRADGLGPVWIDEARSIWRMGFDGLVDEPLTRVGEGFGTQSLPAELCFHHELRDTGSELVMMSVVPFEYDDGTTILRYLDEGVFRVGYDGTVMADQRGMLSAIVVDQLGQSPTSVGSQTSSLFYEGCGYAQYIDWAHGNSLWPMNDGSYLMSLKSWGPSREGQALFISPEGDFQWAVGSEGDFTLEDGEWFSQAHHFEVRRTDAQGRPRLLWVYDNTGLPTTRIVEMSLSYVQGGSPGTARILRQVDVGLRCEIRGGAYETDRGRLLVSCAPEGVFREIGWDFNPSVDVPYWEIRVGQPSCPTCANTASWRGFPLSTLAPSQ